jgi:hypothetical protein
MKTYGVFPDKLESLSSEDIFDTLGPKVVNMHTERVKKNVYKGVIAHL